MMDILGSFHFLRPWWLLLVLPPLLVAVLRVWGAKGGNQWDGVIAPHLLPHLVTGRDAPPWRSPEVLLLPVAVILAVAMAGPAYRLVDTPQGPDDTTLLVVVDLSASMAGRDIGPSRIGRLRLKIRDLMKLRRGGKMGLIAVAGDAHVVMPPTDDLDVLIPYVDVLKPDLMPSDGENFAALDGLIDGLLDDSKGPRVILVAADAIPPDGARALAALGKRGIEVVAWAVGTRQGIPSAGVPGLDRTGFELLERSGAQVLDLTLSAGDLRDLDRILDRARTSSVDPKDATLWEDSGYGLVFIVALVGLFWFRRGWVIGRLGPVLLAFLVGGCGAPENDSPWLDLWLTQDQQGRRLFEQGKYSAAAIHFRDPMWRGIAYYTAHDWKNAQEQFSQVDSVEGLFNLANAHAQAREIQSAIAIYDRVLAKKPTFLAARKNRDYFRKVLAGLQQTSDWDDLKQPAQQPPDPTRARLRPDQVQGPRDKAEVAAQKKQGDKEESLSEAQNQRWMKRVATNPGDFLRSKFSFQEGAKKP